MQSLVAWLDDQDLEATRACGGAALWAALSVFVGGLLWSASTGPFASFFALNPWPPMGAFVALLVGAVVLKLLSHRPLSARVPHGLTLQLGTGLFYFFLALLPLSAGTPHGAASLAAFLVLVPAYHGSLTGASYTRPYIATPTLVAPAIAWMLFPAPDRLAPLVIATVSGAVGSVVLGSIARRRHDVRRERDALLEAVHAQSLAQQVQHESQLRQHLSTLLGEHHDLRNLIGTALLNAESLDAHLGDRPFDEVDEIVRDLAEELSIALSRTKGILESSRRLRVETEQGPELESVDLGANTTLVIESLRRRHPKLTIILDDELDLDRVLLAGGAPTAQRIVENLVANAQEGDGTRAATVVHVRCMMSPEGPSLVVHDNGPGFPPQVLSRPGEAFRTTKANGTGLGLFTVACLAQASGAKLRLRNEGGGAVVQVVMKPCRAVRPGDSGPHRPPTDSGPVRAVI